MSARFKAVCGVGRVGVESSYLPSSTRISKFVSNVKIEIAVCYDRVYISYSIMMYTYLVKLIEHGWINHLAENLLSRNEQALSRWVLVSDVCCITHCRSILLHVFGCQDLSRSADRLSRGRFQPDCLCLSC